MTVETTLRSEGWPGWLHGYLLSQYPTCGRYAQTQACVKNPMLPSGAWQGQLWRSLVGMAPETPDRRFLAEVAGRVERRFTYALVGR